MNIKWIIQNKSTIVLLAVYFVVGFFLLDYYKYSQRGDIISYISISEKYIDGNFSDAVNGVWSPLTSWLLIPFLLLKINALYGFKLLQLIIGGLILLSTINYFKEQKINFKKISIASFLLSIIIFYFSFFIGSPDLLVAYLFMRYTYLLSNDKYFFNQNSGIVIGLIAGVAFYAKAYALPFVIVHFTLINFYYFNKFTHQRQIIKKKFVQAILIFFALSSIWILFLSFKYGYFTYSTASNYNFNIIGPKYQSINTFRLNAIYPPVNSTAVSYWEDPTFLPIENWNPISSTDEFIFFISHISKNIFLILTYIFLFSPLFFPLFVFRKISKKKISLSSFIMIITIIIYSFGYSILFVYERFLIIVYLFVVIVSYRFLIEYIEIKSILRWKMIFLIIVFCLSVCIRPIYSSIKYFNEGKDLNELGVRSNADSITGNFAALSLKTLEDDWSNTLYIAYFTKSKFYGEIDPALKESEIYSELKKYKIDYLFDWTGKKITDANRFNKVLTYKMYSRQDNPFGSVISMLDKVKAIVITQENKSFNSCVTVYKIN